MMLRRIVWLIEADPTYAQELTQVSHSFVILIHIEIVYFHIEAIIQSKGAR